jgi:putative ABC transport system permease protein
MNWWHRLVRRKNMEEQLEKELQFHIDEYTNDLLSRGYDPKDASRLARLTLGGAEQVKEQCRDARGTRWLEDLLQDIRYAGRGLRRSPGFTTVSLLALALGIGASTAIFSAVNPILFEPLPYPRARQVQMIWYAAADGSRSAQTFGTYRELAQRSRSFDTLAVMKPWQPTMTGPAEPERFEGQMVSAGYFQALGVLPAIGREFQTTDDQLRGPKVVVISYSLWQRRWGRDPAIVGRQVALDDDLYTVIGVMPRAFENILAADAEIWSPLQYDASLPPQSREWGHHLRMVARLRPGVTTDDARRELAMIAHTPMPDFPRQPGSSMAKGLIINSLQDEVTSGVRPALLAVLGAVVLVLLIACVNVTNLLLARGAQRQGELAMRAALGAGRTRLIRQLVTESLLLAVLGGGLGMVVAEFGVGALVALSPPALPRLDAIRVDTAAFAFAVAVSALVGLLVGLIPSLQAASSDLWARMNHTSRRSAGGHQLTRRTLVVAEVALALVLLVSAGLLLRSLKRLFAVAPGFDPSNAVTMQVQTYGHRFDDDSTTHRFFGQALDAVRQVPGVTAAAFTAQLPLSGENSGFEVYGVQVESDLGSEPAGGDALRYAVTPGYFETMGIRLLRGRLFDADDVAGAPVRPVVISESFAGRLFPGQDPIGRRIRFGGPADRPWDVVVGVVGNVKQSSLAINEADAVYVTAGQWLWADGTMWLVARTHGDAAAFAPAIKKAIWSIDKDQPIVRVGTMEQLLATSAAERRFVLILFEAFALAALVLAATGIYGVLSGSVTERMREIGVRAALGATRADILVLVVRQGMGLTGVGFAIGLSGAVAASRALVSLLFGVSPLDSATYIGALVMLTVASAIACCIPAWRAARVDPSITLRAE